MLCASYHKGKRVLSHMGDSYSCFLYDYLFIGNVIDYEVVSTYVVYGDVLIELV
jgi:hypothetical protein